MSAELISKYNYIDLKNKFEQLLGIIQINEYVFLDDRDDLHVEIDDKYCLFNKSKYTEPITNTKVVTLNSKYYGENIDLAYDLVAKLISTWNNLNDIERYILSNFHFQNIRYSDEEMIQQVITRMGHNSFALKGWTVGIMIAIFTFTKDVNKQSIILTIVPIIIFWCLDTYYLLLERKFRCLYNDVRKRGEKEIDFDMNFNNVKVTINDLKNLCFFKVMVSISEISFYATCIATTLVLYWIGGH